MASSSSQLLLLILLFCIAMVTVVSSRPSHMRADSQILQDLFGPEVSSLLLTQPEVVEGSAQNFAPSERHGRGLAPHNSGAEPHHKVPRLFLEFLAGQRKLRGRSRKSSARGCFGMKVDRIGVLSGLGC